MLKNRPHPKRALTLIAGLSYLLLCTASVHADDVPQTVASSDGPTVRVLVAYYSLSGNTQQMARAVLEGTKRVKGVEPILKKIADVSKEDLVRADAILLGSPTYYANIPGKMKVILDDWSWKMKVDFTDKVGGAFATGGGNTGGKEHVVVSLLLFMLNNRMIVAGPLYEDESGEDFWGELGAAAATGPISPGLTAAELDGALRVGQRVAQVAKKLHTK